MDPWIPNHYDLRIGEQPVTKAKAQTRVDDWIDPENRTWKADVVRNEVSGEEAQLILNVLIPTEHKEDEMMWPFERGGRISSKSAYHFIQSKETRPDIGAADQASVQKMWSAIWKVRMLPKIKVFAWKLGAKVVAVRESLAQRGIQVYLSYTMCDHAETR